MNEDERERLEQVLVSLDAASAPDVASRLPVSEVPSIEQAIPKRQLRRSFLAEVARSPGITVTQASLRLETTRDSLNPVVKQVLAERLVAKQGAGYALHKPKAKAELSAEKTYAFMSRGQGNGRLGAEETL
jgi:hypothetical protein